MKKLLIISSNSIHLFNFYQLIKDYFDEIEIVTNNENKNFDYKNTKIHYISFSLKKPIKFLCGIKKLKTIIQKFKPNIVHAHQIGNSALMAVRAGLKTKTPVVATAWGSDVLITPNLSKLHRFMVKYVLNNTDFFTADAHFVAKKIKELANKKIEVSIANFASVEVCSQNKKENIVFSNRQFKKLYRIDAIIKAFALFAKNHNEWKLVIAGEGLEKENLKKLANELGISSMVEFVGWLNSDENKKMYERSRIFVSIPESDGTSISLLEAMGASCIPIVSDLPANREWIKDNKNGIIVQNIERNFIERAVQLDPKSVADINKNIISKSATFEANKRVFLNIYEKILQK